MTSNPANLPDSSIPMGTSATLVQGCDSCLLSLIRFLSHVPLVEFLSVDLVDFDMERRQFSRTIAPKPES